MADDRVNVPFRMCRCGATDWCPPDGACGLMTPGHQRSRPKEQQASTKEIAAPLLEKYKKG